MPLRRAVVALLALLFASPPCSLAWPQKQVNANAADAPRLEDLCAKYPAITAQSIKEGARWRTVIKSANLSPE